MPKTAVGLTHLYKKNCWLRPTKVLSSNNNYSKKYDTIKYNTIKKVTHRNTVLGLMN